MKDQEIYRTLVSLCHQGRQMALATVVQAKGATPRGVGAKMILVADGQSLGTIGGGCVEEQVKQAAREFFASAAKLSRRRSQSGRRHWPER